MVLRQFYMSLKKLTTKKRILLTLAKQSGTRTRIGRIIKNSGKTFTSHETLISSSEFVCGFYEKWNQFYVLDILEETTERPPELDRLIERKLGSDCFSEGSTQDNIFQPNLFEVDF